MTTSAGNTIVCSCSRVLKWQCVDSLRLVCSYCQTKHSRLPSATVEHEKTMLQFDSPVKIDMQLKLNGQLFTVCGRTQWYCESQNTQLWTLVDDNQRCNYLHETWGEFFVLKESRLSISSYLFEDVHPDKELTIGSELYHVTRIDKLNEHRTEGETGIDYRHLSNTFQIYMRTAVKQSLHMAWIHSKTSVILYTMEYCEPLEGKTDTKIRFLPIHS